MDDVAHGKLDDLARLGARNVGHLDDLRRHVARRGVLADLVADLLLERGVELGAIAQPHEQDDADVVVPVLADDDRFQHLVHLLDLAVDLGRADANAARIQHRVRPAVNDHAIMRGDLGPVAVRPYAREALEIGRVIFLAVGIVPEADRHRRKRLQADELALGAARRLAGLVEHLDRQTQPAGLDLAPPHRPDRISQHEARHDVGAARDRGEMNVALHLGVDVVEALGHQRRSGRGDGAQRAKFVALDRFESRLGASVDELGRGAEQRHVGGVGEIVKHVAVGIKRRAVEQQQRRLRGERRDEPVPHHPRTGGEVEHAVVRLDVAVEPVLLQVLEERPAHAVHDAFRHAGGARRIKNIERMVERHPDIVDVRGLVGGDEIAEQDRLR